MVKKYRKKPMVVDTIQYDGTNQKEIEEWTNYYAFEKQGRGFVVETLEGFIHISKGDWVVRGIKGEYWPVKPDIFALTYEEVQDGTEAK